MAAYERTHSAEISKGAGLLGTKSGALLPEMYRLPMRSDWPETPQIARKAYYRPGDTMSLFVPVYRSE